MRSETRVKQVAFVELDTNCKEETSVLNAAKRSILRRKTRNRVRLGDSPKDASPDSVAPDSKDSASAYEGSGFEKFGWECLSWNCAWWRRSSLVARHPRRGACCGAK